MEFVIFTAAICSFVLSFFLPKAVLLTIVAIFPYYKIIGTVSIAEAEISAFDGLIMVLFVATILKLPIMLRQSKIIRFDIAMVFWVIINLLPFVFYRDDLIYGLNTFRNFVAIPVALYFMIRFYVTDIKMMNRLLWLVVISTAIMSILGVVEFLQIHVRIRTVLDGGHAGSIIMAIGMFSGIYLFSVQKRLGQRLILGTAILMNLIGIILVLGRIMIPAVVIIPFIVSFVRKRHPSVLLTFTLCFLIVGFAAPLQVKLYDEGIKAFQKQQRQGIDPKSTNRMIDEEQTKAALGVRALPYYISLDYIAKKPFLGYGYSIHNYLKEHEKFHLSHSHNVGLDILLRTGFIGLVAFIWLLLIFINYVSSGEPELTGSSVTWTVFISLFFIILANSFANSMHNLATSCGFWLSISLTVSLKTLFSNIKTEPSTLKKESSV